MSFTLENTKRSKDSKYITPETFDDCVWYLENTDFDEEGNLVSGNYGDTPVLIMIQARWCGACKKMKPAYQELARYVKTNGLNVLMCTIDSEENKNLLERISNSDHFGFKVEGYPTMVVYYKNKYVTHKAGALIHVDQIKQFVDTSLLKINKNGDGDGVTLINEDGNGVKSVGDETNNIKNNASKLKSIKSNKRSSVYEGYL